MESDASQPRETEPSPVLSENTAVLPPEQPAARRPALIQESKGFWGGLLAIIALVWGKFKLIMGFLGMLLGKSKVLLTGASMLLSVGAYAMVYPLPFAIGFVLLILIHEMGHVLVLMKYGLKATAPVFIPFVGAMVGLKEMPKNVEMEAWVGYGGPLLGTAGAFLCYALYWTTQEELLLVLAHTAFFLNLFNLIPIHPLDGGRVTGALSKWFWVVGWLMGLGWFILGNQHPLMLIILLVGGFKVFNAFFNKNRHEDPSYYDIPATSRAWIALAYFSLVIVLSVMSLHTDELLSNRSF